MAPQGDPTAPMSPMLNSKRTFVTRVVRGTLVPKFPREPKRGLKGPRRIFVWGAYALSFMIT